MDFVTHRAIPLAQPRKPPWSPGRRWRTPQKCGSRSRMPYPCRPRMNLKLVAMPLPGSAACLLTTTRQPRATVRPMATAYAVSILITWQFLITEEGFCRLSVAPWSFLVYHSTVPLCCMVEESMSSGPSGPGDDQDEGVLTTAIAGGYRAHSA